MLARNASGLCSAGEERASTYALVPAGIRVRNQVAEGLQRLRRSSSGRRILSGLGLLSGRGRGLGGGGLGGRRRRGLLGLGVERADLQPGLVLLKHALVVVLPEHLGGVLAADALEDLLAACLGWWWWLAGGAADLPRLESMWGALCDATNPQREGQAESRERREGNGGLRTWVVLLELGHIVDVAVDDDVQVLRRLVGGDVRRAEGLGHGWIWGCGNLPCNH